MSKTSNKIEEEVNNARAELYREQKNLSPDERVMQMQAKTKIYSEKYGIKIAGVSKLLKAQ